MGIRDNREESFGPRRRTGLPLVIFFNRIPAGGRSRKFTMPNRLSFGPSHEEQDRKKTVRSIEGARLCQNYICRNSGRAKTTAAESLPTHEPNKDVSVQSVEKSER